jgi:membrane protease YdiL (CAAX protease family)
VTWPGWEPPDGAPSDIAPSDSAGSHGPASPAAGQPRHQAPPPPPPEAPAGPVPGGWPPASLSDYPAAHPGPYPVGYPPSQRVVAAPAGAQTFFTPRGPAQAWRPRPYQQLLRGPNLRWWRPLLSAGVMAAICMIGFAVSVGGALVYVALSGGLTSSATETGSFERWSVTPVGLLANNLLLAALIPVAQVAVWAGFGWRPRWVASVVGGIRWRWLLTCVLVAIVMMGALTVLAAALTGGAEWNPEPSWGWLLLVVAITTPLQAAGEEYLFRGWMQQTIGSVAARPLLGAVIGGTVSTTLFALAHGVQDPWLFADRFAFGAVASVLAYRTGGLEAGIALHSVNNLVAFGLTITAGQLQQTLTVTQSDPTTLILDVVTLALAAVVVLLLARRQRVVRLFQPPQPVG